MVADDVITLGSHGVSAAEVVAVARHGRRVELGADARAALERGAAVVARLVDQPEPVYGVSTGFGALANTVIPAARSAELQVALLRSHAAGMGPEVEREVVRAMVFLRARSLAMGFSGARPVVAEMMLSLLAAGVTPVVREHGSLGASGDLAPLASAALVLLGDGAAHLADGSLVGGAAALSAAGLEPLELRAKEGLALINGTDGMLGMLVLALADLDVLLRVADIAGALSTEALLGTDRAFAEDLVAMRPQLGQATSAANLRRAAGRLDDRRQPSPGRRPRPGRLLAAVHAAGPRRGARHRRARPRRRRTRARVVHRQPGGPARRTGRVVRQLPRRADRRGLRLPGHLDRRCRGDQRAAHRPPARPGPLPRPAAVPGHRRRRQLGPHDRPVRAGGDGRREPPPRRPGQR